MRKKTQKNTKGPKEEVPAKHWAPGDTDSVYIKPQKRGARFKERMRPNQRQHSTTAIRGEAGKENGRTEEMKNRERGKPKEGEEDRKREGREKRSLEAACVRPTTQSP